MKKHTQKSRLKSHQKTLRSHPTLAEYKLWPHLRNRKLAGHKFRRQQILGRHIVDFICYKSKLIIELDGQHHADQTQKDLQRTRTLEKKGFKVLRFWNSDLEGDLSSVLHAILKAATTRLHLLSEESNPSSDATRHLLPQGKASPHPSTRQRAPRCHLLPQGEKEKSS